MLSEYAVLTHPMIIGELAMGSLAERANVLDALSGLPSAVVADTGEVKQLIESAQLYGRGLSLVDAHLLAAAKLTRGSTLWTRDKRLAAVAGALGVLHPAEAT